MSVRVSMFGELSQNDDLMLVLDQPRTVMSVRDIPVKPVIIVII